MRAEDKRALFEGLGLIEDWLGSGYRSDAPLPDFEDGPLFSPRSREPGAPAATGAASAAKGAFSPEPLPGDSMERIAEEVVRCAKCRLAAGRKRTVFGQGAANPLVLVVGEGPGAEEDARGLPFVGAAGRLLDKMLASVGLSRETNCYVANIVKCRPPMNRDPSPDEQEACIGYLRRQVVLLKPRLVLSVGRVPSQALLGTKEGITRLRGRFYEVGGLTVLPTFHPSALLRDEALKRPAWEDLKALKARLAQDAPSPAAPFPAAPNSSGTPGDA